ncbi:MULTISPECIES: sigma-70 family RNA polymerase sigma factor [Bacillus]|uniref:sigma-70 family RNA polymerase sigma factor n=1 Tax=Bacillus TaxID=1386 RepID=UPI000D025346|nr:MULTISPECIES: sigma-70 family RNA polymerase sigma factor [Bacillus]MDG4730135.1 sigma-70 family RNA polymerase sigma factor [Bacillus pumilus]PRS45914.1 RNA polymerase subunit sigma-70 [Bacillus sp. GBSC66]
MDYRLLLKAKWKEIIDHPLIQQFLSNPKNEQLLRQVMEEPNEENAKKLDSEFKQFYQKIRIIKYISTMIRIFSVDFDKRVKKKQQRFPLILDHSDTQEVKDPVQTDTYEAVLFNQQDLGEHLQDQTLYKAYQQLTDKQKMVLTQIYVEGQTMKEIADQLGETRQNISNIHKKALNKLKEETGGDVRARRQNHQWGNGRTH